MNTFIGFYIDLNAKVCFYIGIGKPVTDTPVKQNPCLYYHLEDQKEELRIKTRLNRRKREAGE